MGTRSVRLDEDTYERVMAAKRDDETVSEAIERLIQGPSLLTLAGVLSDDEAASVREVLDEVDEDARADVTATVSRFERSADEDS